MATENVALNFALSGQDGVSAVVSGATNAFAALAREAVKGTADAAAAQAKYQQSLGNSAVAAKVSAAAARDLAAAEQLAATRAENAARAGLLQAGGASKADAARAIAQANREAAAAQAALTAETARAEASEIKRIATLEKEKAAEDAAALAAKRHTESLSAAKSTTAATEAANKIFEDRIKGVTAGIRAHNGAISEMVSKLTGAGEGARVFVSAGLNVLHSGTVLAGFGVLAFIGSMIALRVHFSETAAEMQHLGGPESKALADGLRLSQKAAISLADALQDLRTRGNLAPTADALSLVARNAKSMGLDGEKAVVEYTLALAKGGEALADFERKNGRLALSFGSLAEAAEQFKVDPKLSEIAEKTLTTQEQVKRVLVDQNTAANQLLIAEQQRDAFTRSHNAQAAGESRQRADDAQRTVDRLAAQQAKLQEQLRSERDIANWAKVYADRLADVDDRIAEAAGELKTQASIDQKITLELEKQELIRRRLAVLAVLDGVVAKDILDTERKKLATLQTATQRDVNADFAAKESLAQAARAKSNSADAMRLRRFEFEQKALLDLERSKAAAIPAEQAAARAQADIAVIQLEFTQKIKHARAEAHNLHVSDITVISALEQEKANKIEAIHNALATHDREQLNSALQAAQKAADDEWRRAKELADKKAKYNDDVSDSLLKARLGGSTNSAEQAEIKLKIIEIETVNALAKARRDAAAIGENAERAMLAVTLDAASKRKQVEDAEFKRKITQALAVANSIKSAMVSTKMQTEIDADAAAARAVAADWLADKLMISKRAVAAVEAAFEAAKAIASYPSIPDMVAHGTAAIAYGAVAGGFTAPATASAGNAGASPASGKTGGAGGGNSQPVVNNYFLGFGTIQQMGRHIQQAQDASKNTGFAKKVA